MQSNSCKEAIKEMRERVEVVKETIIEAHGTLSDMIDRENRDEAFESIQKIMQAVSRTEASQSKLAHLCESLIEASILSALQMKEAACEAIAEGEEVHIHWFGVSKELPVGAEVVHFPCNSVAWVYTNSEPDIFDVPQGWDGSEEAVYALLYGEV